MFSISESVLIVLTFCEWVKTRNIEISSQNGYEILPTAFVLSELRSAVIHKVDFFDGFFYNILADISIITNNFVKVPKIL